MSDDVMRLLGSIDANVQTLVKNDSDKETRIRRLENWQFKIIGAAGAVSLVVGFAFKVLGK